MLVLAVGALAHARATRLVVADRISQPLRAAVVRRYGTGGLGYALHCRWCAGLWLAFPAAGLAAALSGLAAGLNFAQTCALDLLLALAYSHVTALLARLEDQD